MTISSVSNLLLTIIQYSLVLFYLLKGDIRKSVLFHFVFAALSLSAQGTLGMMDSQDFSLYNYAGIKLIGPVRACYAMNILYVICLTNPIYKFNKQLLFYRLFRTMLILCISASAIGLIGLLFNPYYSYDSFIGYGIYAFVVITSMYILLKVANNQFIYEAYHYFLAALMAGIAGSFVCYFFGGVISHYSAYDIAYLADITILAPALIVGIPSIRQKGLLWLSLLLYGVLILTTMGGKSVFAFAFSFGALAYLFYFDKSTKRYLQRKEKILRPFVIIVGIGVVYYVLRNVSSDSMASYKFNSALSMFSGNISDMSSSPYIRVASLINILNDGLSNPLALLFGNGYGGYFEDKLGLFAGFDLSNGAWSDQVISTGRFTSGHDALVSVPLFNGLVGLFLLLKACWEHIKRIPFNYLNSVAFLWIVLMFYFNTNYAFIGLFALIGAEYDLLETRRFSNDAIIG